MRRSWCPAHLGGPDRPIRRGCRLSDRPIRRGCRFPRRCPRRCLPPHHRQRCSPNRRRLPSRQSQTERPSCRWDQLLLLRNPTSREIHQRKERQSRRDVSAFSELRIQFRVRTCARPDARDIADKDFAPAGTRIFSMRPRPAFAALRAGLVAVARTKTRRSELRVDIGARRRTPAPRSPRGRERHLESGRAADITTGRLVRKRLLDCAARESETNDAHLQRARSRGVSATRG
jgi:hypothetical protein